MKTLKWLFIIIDAIIAASIYILVKAYTQTNNNLFIITAVILAVLLVMVDIIILRSNKLSVVYPMVKIISVLIVIVAGIFIFKESLTTSEIMGIILSFVALYLLVK